MGTMYAIHSTVRARHNRTQRAQAPAHHRMKQHVGSEQARLVRGRPLMITEEKLIKELEHLQGKNKQGILEVRTMDGRILDLFTLKVAEAAPTTPLPNPPLDSAKNDSPHVGQKIPTFVGGMAVQDLPPVMEEEEVPPMVEEEELQVPAEFLVDESEEAAPEKTSVEVDSTQSRSNDRRGGKGRNR